MSLTDRERAMTRYFGEAHRRRELWTSALLFTASLASGLIGALFGLQTILILFGAVALVMVLRFAVVLARRALSGDSHA